MKRVAGRVCGHHPAGDVCLHDVDDRRFDREERQSDDQLKALATTRIVAAFELIHDRGARHELMSVRRQLPPGAGPLAPSDHVRLRARFVVELATLVSTYTRVRMASLASYARGWPGRGGVPSAEHAGPPAGASNASRGPVACDVMRELPLLDPGKGSLTADAPLRLFDAIRVDKETVDETWKV